MAYPTDQVATADLMTAAQINRWCVMLADKTLVADAASIDFASIPAHWSHLLLVVYARLTAAVTGEYVWLRFNDLADANYSDSGIYWDGAATVGEDRNAVTGARFGLMPGANAPANMFGNAQILISQYAGTTGNMSFVSSFGARRSTTVANVGTFTGDRATLAAINEIELFTDGTNYLAGSQASLYGMGRI